MFPKRVVNSSNYARTITLLHIDHCQLHSVASFPFGDYSKSYYFLLHLTQASSLMKAGKAHAVCLSPREDCIFYLSPLGFIFTVNSWLKCNQPRNPPYVLSCHSSLLASRVKHGGGTQHCQPSHKNSQTLVWLYWEAMDVLQSVSTQQETRGAWGLRKEVYNFKQCKLNSFFWRRMKSLKN